MQSSLPVILLSLLRLLCVLFTSGVSELKFVTRVNLQSSVVNLQSIHVGILGASVRNNNSVTWELCNLSSGVM